MGDSPGQLAVREARALSNDFGATMSGAQLKFIANSDFIPAGLRGNLPAIGACVATGRALGLADMTALRSIAIIDGKASFSAELMVSLARKAGHSIVGETSATKVTVTGTRGDNGDTMTVTWTIDDAERVGLLSKAVWKKHPEDLLWARAASALCRRLFADCFAGASHTPEELGAGDVTADELLAEPAVAESVAEEPVAGEVVAVSDEEIDENLAGGAAAAPVVSAEEQKDKLLELFAKLNESKPDTDWGGRLTAKIKKDYKAKSYNDLTGEQMTGLLGWLEEQLAA